MRCELWGSEWSAKFRIDGQVNIDWWQMETILYIRSIYKITMRVVWLVRTWNLLCISWSRHRPGTSYRAAARCVAPCSAWWPSAAIGDWRSRPATRTTAARESERAQNQKKCTHYWVYICDRIRLCASLPRNPWTMSLALAIASADRRTMTSDPAATDTLEPSRTAALGRERGHSQVPPCHW